MQLLRRAGWDTRANGRSYYATVDDPDLEVRFARAQVIPRFVAAGVLDAGITGLDWILETGADVVTVCDLVYSKATWGPARWVLAVPQGAQVSSPQDLQGKRIATEAVNITLAYLRKHSITADVEFSWGTTEAWLPDMADAIVEITETGESLRANKLRVLDTVLDTRPKLIASPAAWADSRRRSEIETLSVLLRGALRAMSEHMVGLKMNVSEANLEKVLALLPALRQPTISPLVPKDWVAVEAVVGERPARDLIPELIRSGAEGIVEYPLNKVIER